MPGFDNNVLYAENIDFTGGDPVVGQVTTDGQLLIGSTAAPNIRVGSLSSSGGTIAITTGPGTINLESGGSVATTFTAEDSSTCAPLLGNLNIVGTATNGINTTAAGNTMTVAMASPYADGDFAFTSSVAGTNRTVTVSNSDNTSNSQAHVQVTVGGAATTGDPYTNFLVTGAGTYSLGIDNSVANDPFKITSGANPSSGTDLFTMTSTGVITLNNALDVTDGGTGVTTLTQHGVLLGNGANDIQALGVGATGTVLIGNTGADPSFSATPSVTSITIANAPSAGTDGANKTYVDLIASGIQFKNTVKAASTGPFTVTYNNGSSGVGAFLTNAGALAAFSTDGYSASVGDRILIKDQAAPAQNGIYSVTTVGSGAVAWVLTRTSDYDTPAEMSAGSLVPVQFGSTLAETFWLQTTVVAIVGTDAVSYNQFLSSLPFATVTQTKVGTSATTVVNPADIGGYMDDLQFTGFLSWAAGGPFFDSSTLGSFSVLVGGTGYIKGKQITWTGPQTIAGMTAGNTYYIYMDSTGTIQKTPTRTDALFTDNIVLFECLRDSTAPTNNQVTVKENHPYNYSATVSNYEHDNIGPLIENNQNGANITLNGTQKIQINGADVLSDHGLETTIPDSGGVAVTWNKKYTLNTGKWALQNISDTFSGFWNNAGTPTALSANRFAVYTLYVSKDNLNSATPTYFTVLDTSQYNTAAAATTAISNGTTAKATNELAQLELAQLGYVIFGQAANAIVSVIIAKKTFGSQTSTAGTNQASLVNTNTSLFNGWLSTADTNVQAALDTLDDSQRCVEVTGAAANLVSKQGAIANRATLVTLTLPTVAAIGDTIQVVGNGAGGWLIAQNANQTIHIDSSNTTTGVGGSLASTNRYDCVKLICTVANLDFVAYSIVGNITVV
jgi:hypothetical protein